MDRRRSAYSRRLVKASQREKRLGILAMLGLATGVAGVLADLAMGRRPRHDLSPFRWGRFRRFRQPPSSAI